MIPSFHAECENNGLKPEHLYQPGRLLRRLIHKGSRTTATALTSFGLPLDVMPDELISNSIRRKGIYDLVTAEVIFRLLDPGAHALDVGAHVGLMSTVMALQVGSGGSSAGSVQSFEPHPAVYAKLCANADRLNQALGKKIIRAQNTALSDSARHAPLFLPEDWAANTGVARLDSAAATSESVPVMVECRTLDDARLADAPDLMKLDVEGHELAVLRGAARTLAKLRDIVFEDFGSYPTPVMSSLEQYGFQVFALYRTLRHPLLVEPERRGIPPQADPNYLATRHPERARERFASAGWNVLRRLV